MAGRSESLTRRFELLGLRDKEVFGVSNGAEVIRDCFGVHENEVTAAMELANIR
jgi:hypothetical protein